MGDTDGSELLADPTVCRAKFDRELAQYREIARDRRRLGWWLLEAEYPTVLFAFAAPQVRPAGVLFGALIDFTNYDLWAPSVRIVNPFTAQPYRARDLPPALTFQRRVQAKVSIQLPGGGVGEVPGEADQPLLSSHGPDDVPFLCVPGVREYHEHPAHSGDSWLLHRGTGEGRLYFLLDILYRYGSEPIKGYQVQMIPQLSYARPESPP